MAINFPNSPTNNQVFLDPTSGNQYIYDSTTTKWKSYYTAYTTQSLSLDYGLISDSITGQATIDYGSVA